MVCRKERHVIIVLKVKLKVQELLVRLGKNWFEVGEYKKLPNEVGGSSTTLPENVHLEMKALLYVYNKLKNPSFEDILDFHQKFESIHPFQDGNGRVGRLIMFRELLRLCAIYNHR